MNEAYLTEIQVTLLAKVSHSPIIEATFHRTRISDNKATSSTSLFGQVAEMNKYNKKYSYICEGPMVLLIKMAEIDII